MIDSCTLKKHAELARRIAGEGIVLLENRHEALPLPDGCRVAFFGRGQLEFTQGGTGAAAVNSISRDTLAGVLNEGDCPIRADEETLARYRADSDYLPSEEELAVVAGRCDAACVILARNAGEGADRKDSPGDFCLSSKEKLLLERLGSSPFRRVVIVVNSGGLIELGWFSKYESFQALLLVWQPGMGGLRALVDVLVGKVNPSGRLADTIAEHCADWPSTKEFQMYRRRLEYSEDIYVGYRFFETVPDQRTHVLYPFGHGLSYTTFSIRNAICRLDGEILAIDGMVANTGSCSGKEVVQCYVHSPGEDRPLLELCAFDKTEEIAPGAQAVFHLEFQLENLSRFDDTGAVCGCPGSFVLARGRYSVYVGASIRNLTEVGSFDIDEARILETPGNRFIPQPARRLRADGTFVFSGSDYSEVNGPDNVPPPLAFPEPVTLEQVAEGKNTLEEMVSQLTPTELVGLCHGQPPARPNCTGGVGGLRRYGVPTLQTADGPAGIRCGAATSCFPCATLVACTWNVALAREMGVAIAAEGYALGLDILLAPGVNIHRNPLNGRNFEYYSEDPLLAGKCAASMVCGIQASGMSATVKHFACNSRENTRRLCDSIVSERALREIYLRGFEIAVKEGRPHCVMSSYNCINGVHASTSGALLTQVLRNEWGFDGVVMTDWMTTEPLWKELLAGNDLKMPCVTSAEAESTARMDIDMDRIPVVSRSVMETSAMRILTLILKSRRFKEHPMPKVTFVPSEGTLLGTDDVTALSHSGIGIAPSTDPGAGAFMLRNLRQNYWKTETALYYRLRFAAKGRYSLRFRIATPSSTLALRMEVDGLEIGRLQIQATSPATASREDNDSLDQWSTQGTLHVNVDVLEDVDLRLVFDDPNQIGCALHFVEIAPEN